MEFKRNPVLVGHPLNALEREIKRLLVREQLEKEQNKLLEEDDYTNKEMKSKLLQLYELYETFRSDDNTPLSGTDTKQNLYKMYTDVFNAKRPETANEIHSSREAAAKKKAVKERVRPFTCGPFRSGARSRNQTHTSVPATFPRGNGHDRPPLRAHHSPLHKRRSPPRPTQPGAGRPQSAPANFHYNNLYTANRCYTARRTCENCNEHCTCILCTPPPLETRGRNCWRDITCAVTPDQNQIEAHWREVSPLIQAHHRHQPPTVANRKRKSTPKKTKEKKPNGEGVVSGNGPGRKKIGKRSREEGKSVTSRSTQKQRQHKPQQAWEMTPKTDVNPPKSTKKKDAQPAKKDKVTPAAGGQQQSRPRPQYIRPQRRAERRYKWDKGDSDSESSVEGEGDVLDEGMDGSLGDGDEIVHRGRILRERKRHKWGDYQAVLTSRALYMYNREYDTRPKEILPLWGTTMSINADRTDLQFSFILKTTSTQKNKAMYKMSCLTGEEMKIWLTKIKLAMKLNADIASEMARNKKPSGELGENPSWSHEGYRVDISYISDNILVCSFPQTKSDVYELKRFLDDKHRGNYRIANVSQKSYDVDMFQGAVTSYPTPADGIFPLTSLWEFCVSTETWLKEDDSNVILVHCQSGHMPSGLFIAAYLVHSRICWTSEQAAKQFRTKRQGATISLPCHFRYLKYIETSVIGGDTPEDIQLLISKLSLSNAPAFNEDGSCKPYFVIYQNEEEIYEFESEESYRSEVPVSFPLSLQISGDIKIQFYSVSDILGTQEMFTIFFHTFYINTSVVRFSRDMIDGAHLNTFKQFTDSFSVTLEVK